MKEHISPLIQTVFLLILLLLPGLTYAQAPGFDDDVTDVVPLDGGLGLLAAAGIAYGIRKYKDIQKVKKAKSQEKTNSPYAYKY